MPRDDDRRVVDSAEATLVRDIERAWRNWKAFIGEKQDELASQQADESPESDLTGAGRPAPRKARLDSAVRQQFGAVLEARRQQAQTKAEQDARTQGLPAPDADQVYARLLDYIMAELDGTVHPSGMALVWYKESLIKFDADALMAGMTDADYLAVGGGTGPSRPQLVAALGVVGVLLVVLYFMVGWAFGPATIARSADAGTARVGQQTTPLWTIAAASVGDATIAPDLRGVFPPLLCMPDTRTTAPAPGTTLVLTSTAAIRTYQVQATTDTAADLRVADCRGAAPVPLASAQLVETHTRAMLDRELLRAVGVRGSDLDPQTIPANQMEVLLDLDVPDASAGTLILADGRRWAATRSAPTASGTQLWYLVPAAAATQPAGWELPRGAGLPALLALNLPAPTSRAALLRQALAVQVGRPTIADRDGQPELRLDLIVTLDPAAATLTLLPEDIAADVGGTTTVPLWDPPTLVPGTSTTLALRVPLGDRADVTLALAGWRARITTE